jgi:hypothetical protein
VLLTRWEQSINEKIISHISCSLYELTLTLHLSLG